jgi:bacterioferritin
MFRQHATAQTPFLDQIVALRAMAAPHLAQPVARPAAIALLQSVLTAEIACVLRYTLLSVSEPALRNAALGAEFLAQADDERAHMRQAAARIIELGGTPDFTPPPATDIPAGEAAFAAQVDENLRGEQAIIAHYRDLLTHFGPTDRATATLLADIIVDEEHHSSDMADLLNTGIA